MKEYGCGIGFEVLCGFWECGFIYGWRGELYLFYVFSWCFLWVGGVYGSGGLGFVCFFFCMLRVRVLVCKGGEGECIFMRLFRVVYCSIWFLIMTKRVLYEYGSDGVLIICGSMEYHKGKNKKFPLNRRLKKIIRVSGERVGDLMQLRRIRIEDDNKSSLVRREKG
jgi:hypothetical protein